jgi:hypothetical protein
MYTKRSQKISKFSKMYQKLGVWVEHEPSGNPDSSAGCFPIETELFRIICGPLVALAVTNLPSFSRQSHCL